MLLNNQTRKILFIQTDDIVLGLSSLALSLMILNLIAQINGLSECDSKIRCFAERLFINWNLLSSVILLKSSHITVLSLAFMRHLFVFRLLKYSLFNFKLQIFFPSEIFSKVNIFSLGKVVLFC